MRKAKSIPAGRFKTAKGPGYINRLTDELVARLRDVQEILADHQPVREPQKRAGS